MIMILNIFVLKLYMSNGAESKLSSLSLDSHYVTQNMVMILGIKEYFIIKYNLIVCSQDM